MIPNNKLDEIEFLNYFNSRTFDENVFNPDGSINKNYNSFKKTGTIAQIFEDHWDSFKAVYSSELKKYRPYAEKEIKKVIACHNKDLGCSVYECPDCHDIIFVGHTCKSRICSSCGYKYKNARVESIMQTVYNCKHRQIVFTIPKELRVFLYEDFYLINLLFQAVRETIYSLFNCSFKHVKHQKKLKKYVSKIRYTPGFFSFLHTFGRDMKWNTHIHVLIAELALGSDGSCKPFHHFDFSALRHRYQNILFKLLSKKLKSSKFKAVKNYIFAHYKDGLYVYAEDKHFDSLKSGIEYVARYCGRVPISENRILNYDGNSVTFCYNAHEDDSYHEVTLPAIEFIKLLVRHIVPPQFKIIRYYGFYRRNFHFKNDVLLLVKKELHHFRNSLLKHELSIFRAFHRDPYCCPKCNVRMNFVLCMN